MIYLEYNNVLHTHSEQMDDLENDHCTYNTYNCDSAVSVTEVALSAVVVAVAVALLFVLL